MVRVLFSGIQYGWQISGIHFRPCFNPTYSQTEWNHVYNNMGGVYLALLSKDTASPFMETDAEVAIESTPAKADASKKDETKNEASTPVVKIDIEGITDRIVSLPLPGRITTIFIRWNERVLFHERRHEDV